LPVAVTLLDKSAIAEGHPNFIGLYAGRMGRDDVRAYVEESDCILLLGALLTDINLGGFTAQLDPAAACAPPPQPGGRLPRLPAGPPRGRRRRARRRRPAAAGGGRWPRPEPLAPWKPWPRPRRRPVTVAHLFRRLASFLDERTVVIADPGDALFAAADLPIRRSPASWPRPTTPRSVSPCRPPSASASPTRPAGRWSWSATAPSR
jgi:indolepyruvate decarboxylase